MLRWLARRQANKWLAEAKNLVCKECYDSALPILTQAIQLAPTAYLYDYRGVVLTLAQKPEQASKSFTQALLHAETRDEQARIYFHRCLLSGRAESYALALLDIEQAVLLAPKNAAYREAQKHIAQAKQGMCVSAH